MQLGPRARPLTLNHSKCQRLETLGLRHVLIPRYRPQANRKVERFNRTLLSEWAYRRLYGSNQARLAALPRWLEFCNLRRPHTALGGNPPASRL
jgi:transposase InsO family protein